jgi:tripartite-type tricarboxylate transporter receptor subunit TctC
MSALPHQADIAQGVAHRPVYEDPLKPGSMGALTGRSAKLREPSTTFDGIVAAAALKRSSSQLHNSNFSYDARVLPDGTMMRSGRTPIARRTFLLLSQAALLQSITAGQARAEDYPSRPVTLLVPFTPGGSVDLIARLAAPKMSDRLGQPVVVLNIPGASGAIATMRLINAPADDYTLEIVTPREISTATLVNSNITYDVERDFTYIALGGRSPIVVAGGPTLKTIKTFADLVVEARRRPQGLTYATSGVGSPQNFLGELIKQRFGITLVHVPFSGGTGGLLDVIGGDIDLTIITLSSALQYIKSGALVAYGLAEEKRTPLAPDIAALAETKELADVDMGIWYGLIGPAKMPPEIVTRLNESFHDALKDPAVQAQLHQHATAVITAGTSADFEAYARRDIAFYRSIVQATHMQLAKPSK